MTITERQDEIDKIITEMRARHKKYFPPKRPLTDEEWENCVDDFFYIADRWKGTNLEDFAGEISMLFQKDIERVDKAWRRKNELQKTD